MNEFVQLLILAYFKEFSSNYSIVDLARRIGCSTIQILDYLECLINNELLFYENGLLRLTIKGRNTLYEKNMDDYYFEQNIQEVNFDKWTTDMIYCPQEFSKEKWRGNCQM